MIKDHKGQILLFGLGLLNLIYWVWILGLYGPITFIHCFLLLGILCIIVSLVWGHPALTPKIQLPKYHRNIIILLCTLGLIGFGWEDFRIITAGNKVDNDNGDTILILGAGLIRGEEISLSLQYRLKTGLREHQKNPDAYIIVSGGKGSDESISEAQAMKQWLIAHGVADDQILMEDQSRNTYENFLFTQEVMKQHHIASSHITLITNRFHMRRARYLGEAQGFHISQKPAPDLPFSEPCMYTREFFAMMRTYFLNY